MSIPLEMSFSAPSLSRCRFSLVPLQQFAVGNLTALMGQAWWLIKTHKTTILKFFTLPVIAHALVALVGMKATQSISATPLGIALAGGLILLHTVAILWYFLAAKKLFGHYFQCFYPAAFPSQNSASFSQSKLLKLTELSDGLDPVTNPSVSIVTRAEKGGKQSDWKSLLLLSSLYSVGSAFNMVIFMIGFVLSLVLILSARSAAWPLLKMGLLTSGFLLFALWCIVMLGLFGFQSVVFSFPLIQQSVLTPLKKIFPSPFSQQSDISLFDKLNIQNGLWAGVHLACHRPLEAAVYAALLWVVSVTMLLAWWSPFMLFAGGFLALEDATLLREPITVLLPNAMPFWLQLLALLWGEGSWLLESLFLMTGFYVYWQACFSRATGWDIVYAGKTSVI